MCSKQLSTLEPLKLFIFEKIWYQMQTQYYWSLHELYYTSCIRKVSVLPCPMQMSWIKTKQYVNNMMTTEAVEK